MLEDRLLLLEAKARVHEAVLVTIILQLGRDNPGLNDRICSQIDAFARSFGGGLHLEPLIARQIATDARLSPA